MILKSCKLCPHKCAIDRKGGKTGFCGAGASARVFRWGPHFGEEPPLVGKGGSGCVFFSRCTMKCLYCQNSPWSWKGGGEDKSIAELTEIFRELALRDKCSNWNLVSPTPYLPQIREAAMPLLKEGVHIPFVWNSSGYEEIETLEEFRQFCDCALFDLRYSNDATAIAASAAPGYVKAARSAVAWAYGQSRQNSKVLPPLIVRILVLPGHADEAIENLAWLATELSSDIPVSIMSQFTPAYKALETPPFNRKVTEEEYDSVVEAAADFGFENGWIQGFEAADPQLALLGENMPIGHGCVS
jgi:putative pyruvate formate lyase activating enzyme